MATTRVEQSSDIEKQPVHHEISPPPPSQNSTTTNITPSLAYKITNIIISMFKCIGLFILCIVAYPFTLAYVIASVCLTGSLKSPNECFSSNNSNNDDEEPSAATSPKPKSIYAKTFELKSTRMKIQSFNMNTTTRLGCLALLWLVLTLCIPRLTRVMLFGDRLWKWLLLVVVISLGYPAVTVVSAIFFVYVNSFTRYRNNICYWLDELRNSLTSLLYFGFILVMWLCYFRYDHGLHPSERIDDFATWTTVSLFVGAFLWVTKSAALLKWKGNAVYKRFEGRILTAGFKLYFLSNITGRYKVMELMPWRDGFVKEGKGTKDGKKYVRIQDYWFSIPVSINCIDQVALFLTSLARVTLRDDDGIPEIVAKCQEIATQEDKSTIQYITEEALNKNFGLDEDDAQILFQALKGDQMSDEITYDAFQKWMVDAHKNCLSIGYTLTDALAVISILNNVLIGVIVVVVILVWLLVTGLATTAVLVLIASPLLALSFVFGDTCKTFFQGIIFSFVTHPFDIGDRCIIDGIELEVKRIGILTTMFVKIGTKEKVMHPNTNLATMVITNLEGEPDPSDMIELTLDSSTSMSKILSFKADLESFFGGIDQHGSYEKTIRVVVKEIGSSIKVGISFTHVMNVQDVSHSQCLQKKNNQRYELLLKIKQLLEDKEIQLAA